MSTELVQNLNLLHSGQENFLKAESSEKLKRAIKGNKRTHADIVNKQGDIVFYIRAKNIAWKRPGTVIGTDQPLTNQLSSNLCSCTRVLQYLFLNVLPNQNICTCSLSKKYLTCIPR